MNLGTEIHSGVISGQGKRPALVAIKQVDVI
jgi:hypothetical protein